MTKEYISSMIGTAIRQKSVPDRQWAQGLLADVLSDKLRPLTAAHAVYSAMAKHTKSQFWMATDWQMLPGSEYLDITGMPPAPLQTALGVAAARHAQILTFFGPSGTGKTTCAIRAATYAAMVQTGATIAAIGGMHMGRMTTGELSDFIQCACDADIVILDDIDKGSKSETRSSALLEILESRERCSSAGATIITTNYVGQQLAEKIERQTEGYGLPIVNRLRRGITINFGEKLSCWRDAKNELWMELASKRPGDAEHLESIGKKEDFPPLNWRPKFNT